jgi:hypothetical protein
MNPELDWRVLKNTCRANTDFATNERADVDLFAIDAVLPTPNHLVLQNTALPYSDYIQTSRQRSSSQAKVSVRCGYRDPSLHSRRHAGSRLL